MIANNAECFADVVSSYTESVFSLQDTVSLHGEVCCPNLQFDKMTVDFGCILNDTEVMRYIQMRNTSPMEVSYQWSFALSDQQPMAVFCEPPAVMDTEVVVEDLEDMDADQCMTEIQGDGDNTVDDEMSPAADADVAADVAADGRSDSPLSALCEVLLLCEFLWLC